MIKSKIDIVYKSVDELIPYVNNPRHNENAVDAVASSIKHFGFKQPIVIDSKNEIVAGHTRLLASKKLGLKEVPVIIADDLTEAQVKAFRLADNKVGELASWDYELLDLELEEIEIEDLDFDMEDFGFDDNEINEKGINRIKNLEGIKDDEYLEFEEKFKAKLTTDDCFTPEPVYDVVKNYVLDYYNLKNVSIERPFYPGGDYKQYKYKDNSIVIDNPPFSILKEIKDFYLEKNIKFFLFAPHLTLFSSSDSSVSYIVCGADVIYENGAKVNTSFVTNLDKYKIRTAPTLYKDIVDIQKNSDTPPKYKYPENLITSSKLDRLSKYGVDFHISENEMYFTRALDSQKEQGKAIFGAGYLIGNDKAKEISNHYNDIDNNIQEGMYKGDDEQEYIFELSEREKEIIESLK